MIQKRSIKNLRLFTSNRLEILADKLAGILSTPLSSPMEPEIIVVQSKGMERWISMELARRFGICANVKFPFPNSFVYEMIRNVIPEMPDESPFDPKFTTWKIMNILPQFIDKPGFESIKNFLGDDELSLKSYQLAERIANTLDQYLLYRPEWIFRWENGEEDHWQAVLWRDLVKENNALHRAALGKRFGEILNGSFRPGKNFPHRVSVFGISALPLFHIQILAALSRFIEVNLFLMNPCQAYWFDILSDREIKKKTEKFGNQPLSEDALHLEKGNSLLASMGALGRDFLGTISDFDAQEHSDFEDPGEGNLLSYLKSDILNLRDRDGSTPEVPIADDDRSIQIHSCHSPMREIEVLQDQLLKLFEQNSELQPKDILVMTPDIETYAPYIQAVFDLPMGDPRRIPFSITDRNVRKESRLIATLLAIIDLWNSRFGAAQVMAILESPSVWRKFDLSEPDVGLVRKWISDTRIRWGVDEHSRRAIGLPATSENTWRAGLDRLLLGYALPGQDENMFADVLPYDHIEGNEAEVLGNFLEFTDQLFATVEAIGQPKTLEQWAEFLQGLLTRFFQPEAEDESEFLIIWRTLNDLTSIQQASVFAEKIPIQIIKNYLEQTLEKESFGYGFMTGGVTFCAMLPMRSIPFRVICLMGMNDNAYPRQEKQLGFDLMAKHPQPGDRSCRKDDRYLFLEALLSTREKFYISYIGQSIQDNSLIPPSVLVSELLDYIEAGFAIPDKNIADHLITKHRLQAFSPEYFKGNPKLFSYSSESYQAAKRLVEPRQSPVSFIAKELSIPGDEWKEIDLPDLISFFMNPSKYLLNKRLGIFLEEGISMLDECESFDIENLDRYQLEQNLMAKQIEGQDLKDFLKATKASGILPHGTVGNCVYDNLSRGIENFVQQTKQFIQSTPMETVSVDFEVAGFHLTGRIDGIYPDRLLRFRFAKIKAKDRLRLWLYHLILNCTKPENYPLTSTLIGLNPDGKDSRWIAWEFRSLDESQKILADLLQIYWLGLIKPIHFFPESSWEFVRRQSEKNDPAEAALKAARNVWLGGDFSRGEKEDLYYQLCFHDADPIDDEFADLAVKIFNPMMAFQSKILKSPTE